MDIEDDKVKGMIQSMKNCNFLEENLEEDIISQIYNNNLDFSEKNPETKEYSNIMKEIRRQEKELLYVKGFRNYLETRNIKDTIEAETQFKLGFRTAIKIIIEALEN